MAVETADQPLLLRPAAVSYFDLYFGSSWCLTPAAVPGPWRRTPRGLTVLMRRLGFVFRVCWSHG